MWRLKGFLRLSDQGDSIRQSRREFAGILITWGVFMIWVIGYASARAYPDDPSAMPLLLGFPQWIVWGIALPWLAATLVTIFFSLRIMKDHE